MIRLLKRKGEEPVEDKKKETKQDKAYDFLDLSEEENQPDNNSKAANKNKHEEVNFLD